MGGPKWNDALRHDLVKCGLELDWHELAQDRSAWRGVVKTCVDIINKETEHKDPRKEDGRKSTQQSRLTAAMTGLLCDHPNCTFTVTNQVACEPQMSETRFTDHS